MKKLTVFKKMLSVSAAVAVSAVSTVLFASAQDLSCGVVRFNDRTFTVAPGGTILGDSKNAKNTGWDAVNIPGFTGEADTDNSISTNPELWSKVKTITAKFYIEKVDPTAIYVANDITTIVPYMYFGIGNKAVLSLDSKNLIDQLPDGLKFGNKSEMSVTWNIGDEFAAKGSEEPNGGLTKLGLKLNNTGTDTMKLKIVWTSAEITGDDAVIKRFSDTAVKKYGAVVSAQSNEPTTPPATSAKPQSSTPATSVTAPPTSPPVASEVTTVITPKVTAAATTAVPASASAAAVSVSSQIVSQFAPPTTTPATTAEAKSAESAVRGGANNANETASEPAKASPDTGISDMATIVSLAALAVGSIFILKK